MIATGLSGSWAQAQASNENNLPIGHIDWHACPTTLPRRLECGSLPVPIDHAHVDGPQITLGVTRLKALVESADAQDLVFNPGGPGGSASQALAIEASGQSYYLRARLEVV